MDMMWFLGSGLAIVLAGLINLLLSRDKSRDKLIWIVCLITNATFVVLFSIALFELKQPQVFIGLALFGGATFCAPRFRVLSMTDCRYQMMERFPEQFEEKGGMQRSLVRCAGLMSKG